MRLFVGFTCAAVLSLSSNVMADQYQRFYDDLSPVPDTGIRVAQNAPQQDAAVSDAAPTQVEASAEQSAPAAPAAPAPPAVQHQATTEVVETTQSNACPHCGQVHSVQPVRPAAVRSNRVASEESLFDRVMELERRKNAWLLGLFR